MDIKYLEFIAGFVKVKDHYNNGRICYSYKMINIDIIKELVQDPNFLYIIDNIIYFKAI